MAATTRTNIAQTAVNAARDIVAALVTTGQVEGIDNVLEAFDTVKDHVFNGLAEELAKEPPAPARTGGYSKGGYRKSGGNGNDLDPATLVVNNGKHAGKTLAQIDQEDPEYFEVFLRMGKNEFVKSKIQAYIAKYHTDGSTPAQTPEPEAIPF